MGADNRRIEFRRRRRTAGRHAHLRPARVHSLVAVTAVTIQNSLGVKGLRDQCDIIAGDRGGGHRHRRAGRQDRDAGVLGNHRDRRRLLARAGLFGTTPFVVDPVCASMHGDPLLHPDALDTLRTVLFPLASLITRTSTRCDCWSASTSSTPSQRGEAAGALHDLGPQWVLVKGGHLRGAPDSPDLLYDGTEFHTFDAKRVNTGHDHGAGDIWRRRRRALCARVRDAGSGGLRQGLDDRMPQGRFTLSARGTGRCCSGCMMLEAVSTTSPGSPELDARHRCRAADHWRRRQPEAPMLIALCDEWAGRGWLAIRYNLLLAAAAGPRARRRDRGRRPGGIAEALTAVAAARRPADRRRALLRRPAHLDAGGRAARHRRRTTLFSIRCTHPGNPTACAPSTSARSPCRPCSPRAVP